MCVWDQIVGDWLLDTETPVCVHGFMVSWILVIAPSPHELESDERYEIEIKIKPSTVPDPVFLLLLKPTCDRRLVVTSRLRGQMQKEGAPQEAGEEGGHELWPQLGQVEGRARDIR